MTPQKVLLLTACTIVTGASCAQNKKGNSIANALVVETSVKTASRMIVIEGTSTGGEVDFQITSASEPSNVKFPIGNIRAVQFAEQLVREFKKIAPDTMDAVVRRTGDVAKVVFYDEKGEIKEFKINTRTITSDGITELGLELRSHSRSYGTDWDRNATGKAGRVEVSIVIPRTEGCEGLNDKAEFPLAKGASDKEAAQALHNAWNTSGNDSRAMIPTGPDTPKDKVYFGHASIQDCDCPSPVMEIKEDGVCKPFSGNSVNVLEAEDEQGNAKYLILRKMDDGCR